MGRYDAFAATGEEVENFQLFRRVAANRNEIYCACPVVHLRGCYSKNIYVITFL